MSNRKQYKHKFNKSEQAAYNIQTGRGWECPTCGSFIRAGEDYCYSCGETPEVDAMRMQYESGRAFGYNFHSEPADLLTPLFWISSMVTIPLIGFLNEFAEYDLSMFIVIPLLYVLTRSIIELLKIIEDLFSDSMYLSDVFTIINRTWVFYFSIKAMIPIVKILFPQLV